MAAPFIRVSRKRSADPHEALILHNKRVKHTTVFTLFKAAASGNDQELSGARVVDLPPLENVPEGKLKAKRNEIHSSSFRRACGSRKREPTWICQR